LPRSESWPSFEASISRASSFCRLCSHDGHVVDRHLHLFVVALVGLGDQLVDLAARDLRQDAVAFADGQQNRVQHLVDALDHLAMHAVEQRCLAALRETPSLDASTRRMISCNTSIESSSRPRCALGARHAVVDCMSVCAMTVPPFPAGPVQLPAFAYQCMSA
jgi:hypothetical protein